MRAVPCSWQKSAKPSLDNRREVCTRSREGGGDAQSAGAGGLNREGAGMEEAERVRDAGTSLLFWGLGSALRLSRIVTWCNHPRMRTTGLEGQQATRRESREQIAVQLVVCVVGLALQQAALRQAHSCYLRLPVCCLRDRGRLRQLSPAEERS